MKHKTSVEEFEEWNDVTGALPKGTSWYYECRSIFEDADKKIESRRPRADRVDIPQNEAQAELMAKMGLSWLEANAPHRLRSTPESPRPSKDMMQQLRVDAAMGLDMSPGDPVAAWALGEIERLRQALTISRGQWIHSVNATICLEALGEKDVSSEHPEKELQRLRLALNQIKNSCVDDDDTANELFRLSPAELRKIAVDALGEGREQMTSKEQVRPLNDRLISACVAGCSCLTKTPVIQYHEPLCHYRLHMEALHALNALAVARAALDSTASATALDISENKVICGALTTWTYRSQEVSAVTCRNCLRLLARDECPICGKKVCRGHFPGNGDPRDGSGRASLGEPDVR